MNRIKYLYKFNSDKNTMLEAAIYRLAIFCTKASNCLSATTIQVISNVGLLVHLTMA